MPLLRSPGAGRTPAPPFAHRAWRRSAAEELAQPLDRQLRLTGLGQETVGLLLGIGELRVAVPTDSRTGSQRLGQLAYLGDVLVRGRHRAVAEPALAGGRGVADASIFRDHHRATDIRLGIELQRPSCGPARLHGRLQAPFAVAFPDLGAAAG